MIPTVAFTVAQISYFSSLVVKPSSYRPLFMVPILVGSWYFFQYASNYHTPVEYLSSNGAAALPFIASSYILLTDVQRELFAKGQKEPAYLLPLLGRIKWAMKLNLACRAVGWSHEPKYALPPGHPPSVTRSQFVVQQIRRLALDLVIYDAFMTYAKLNPSFSANGPSITVDGLFWRVVNVHALGLCGSVIIGIPYRILILALVISGISEPQDCPALFGNVFDAYTLQNFWGRFWHQTLRWPGVSHGRFIAYNLLHLQRGSRAAYLVQLYATFAITAAIHVGGEYPMLGYFTTRHAFRFFLLQPVAITVEALVIACGKGLTASGPCRLLGYLWVIGWFTYTVPEWVDPLFRKGLVDTTPTVGIVSRFWGV